MKKIKILKYYLVSGSFTPFLRHKENSSNIFYTFFCPNGEEEI